MVSPKTSFSRCSQWENQPLQMTSGAATHSLKGRQGREETVSPIPGIIAPASSVQVADQKVRHESGGGVVQIRGKQQRLVARPFASCVQRPKPGARQPNSKGHQRSTTNRLSVLSKLVSRKAQSSNVSRIRRPISIYPRQNLRSCASVA